MQVSHFPVYNYDNLSNKKSFRGFVHFDFEVESYILIQQMKFQMILIYIEAGLRRDKGE